VFFPYNVKLSKTIFFTILRLYEPNSRLLANKTVKCKRFLFQNTDCYCQIDVLSAKYSSVCLVDSLVVSVKNLECSGHKRLSNLGSEL
jgi:hypothetical protein